MHHGLINTVNFSLGNLMSIKKILLWSFLALLIIGSWFTYRTVWGKPVFINHFFERIMIEFAFQEPEVLTLLGFVDNTILDFHSNKLSDASPEAELKTVEWARRNLKTLRSYNRDRLTGQKALSYDIMENFLEVILEGEPWVYHNFPVNQLQGIQGALPDFMVTYHVIVDEKSAGRYLQRLEAFSTKFDQVSKAMLYRLNLGIIPPRFVIDHVLVEMEEFISTEPQENILYTHFEKTLNDLEGISENSKSELLAKALLHISTEVYPGYEQLISTMQTILEFASEDAGAWTLPNGADYYQYLVEFHTTLPFKPDSLHQLGLQEVQRIEQEMFVLFDQIGISEGNVAERFAILDEFPGMKYVYHDGVYDEIIADYTAMIEVLDQGTRSLFNTLPSAPVEVRRVPVATQATAPFAYYSIPSLDGSRPGVFYINLRKPDELQKFGMMTLTAHEAIPGHHFQLALAQEIKGVPTFRRILPITAFGEGWALYTEALVAEAGIYDEDPYGDLGRLQAEMFRAVRLVVDTGIHHKRWSLEKATDYMIRYTGMPHAEVVSEIERYVVIPGQALAYKIGMMHIQDLRKKAESELGDRFDIAEFHDAVLLNGGVPMPILTSIVEKFIQERL